MVLLKRNLEGLRVHSYVAACTANLQELYLSQLYDVYVYSARAAAGTRSTCGLHAPAFGSLSGCPQ
jgi:hypothetical protein